jgi:hypothetical protein
MQRYGIPVPKELYNWLSLGCFKMNKNVPLTHTKWT